MEPQSWEIINIKAVLDPHVDGAVVARGIGNSKELRLKKCVLKTDVKDVDCILKLGKYEAPGPIENIEILFECLFPMGVVASSNDVMAVFTNKTERKEPFAITIELHGQEYVPEKEPYEPPQLCEDDIVEILRERDALRRQVTSLLAANTRLLEERRAVDIRYNVEHFHRVMGLPVLDTPQVPSDERVRLRLRLIVEEFFELLEACLGADGHAGIAYMRFIEAKHEINMIINRAKTENVDIVDFADACADLDYVLEGSRLEFGIDGRPVARVVHESNMSKKGSVVREDGKILKGPDWEPPDIEGQLRKQGWSG